MKKALSKFLLLPLAIGFVWAPVARAEEEMSTTEKVAVSAGMLCGVGAVGTAVIAVPYVLAPAGKFRAGTAAKEFVGLEASGCATAMAIGGGIAAVGAAKEAISESLLNQDDTPASAQSDNE